VRNIALMMTPFNLDLLGAYALIQTHS